MKIVQVQTQAEAAGAQRVSDMVGDGLRRRGHQVRTVFMYRKTDAYDADPHADFVLKSPPSGLLGQLRAALGLWGYMLRERPEAVVSYQHYGNLFGTLGGRLAGAKRLIANQSGIPWRSGMRGIATSIDRLLGTLGVYQHNVVNSGFTERAFADYPARYRRRLRRIDHGVLGPDAPHDKATARAAFGLPAGVPLVVTTGRLNVLKNHALLLEALRALPADVHLAIAGEGPERAALTARAEDLQLGARLHLVGEVAPADVFRFLAAGDVYAFPSREETFGLAAVEAAAAGLPVVASTLPVLKEVLGDAAVFIEPDDATGFAQAIAKILADPSLAANLTAAGRRLAAKYAPDAMVAEYEKLLT